MSEPTSFESDTDTSLANLLNDNETNDAPELVTDEQESTVPGDLEVEDSELRDPDAPKLVTDEERQNLMGVYLDDLDRAKRDEYERNLRAAAETDAADATNEVELDEEVETS